MTGVAPVRPSRPWWCRALRLLACLVLLWLSATACSAPAETDQERVDAGGSSPQDTVTFFFDDLNEALQHPDLSQPETRQSFAEQLASYFAPSERIEQRRLFVASLAQFAENQQTVGENEQWMVHISFANVELAEQEESRARVRLVDAAMHLRLVRHQEQYEEVLYEQKRPLEAVLQRPTQALTSTEQLAPTDWTVDVLQVNGRWFLTESTW